MKRRQIQIGSPFEEAQSILGDPLWLVNYAIQVPNQPLSDPLQPIQSVQSTHKELIQPQEVDFRELLLQDTQETTEHQSTLEVEKPLKAQQQSKAQQLIQQSQQLLMRRRQPKGQEDKQIKAIDEPQQTVLITKQSIPQQQEIQQSFSPVVQTIEAPVEEKDLTLQKQSNVIEEPKEVKQPNIVQEESKELAKQQQPSSVIHAQTFYHGLVTYNTLSGELTTIPLESNNVSKYPRPFLNNRNPDNGRHLRSFWRQYLTDNALLQLVIDHLEQPLDKHSAIYIVETKILNDQSGQAFAFDRIHKLQDWETKLLINILYGENINIKQQESLIEYIKRRQYHDDQEAWLIRLAVLLKMVPVDKQFHQELLLQLQHLYTSEQIQARLLWLLLKLDIKETQVEEFILSYFTKLNYNLCHSQIQLLLGDSHAYYHNQTNAELNYRLGLMFVESQQYDKALECSKNAIDLGCIKARDLRERILQVIDLSEKSKTNNNGGLFGYFGQAVNAVKNIKQQPVQQPYTPQQQNFYYDKELKAYVINGVPQVAQVEEEPKKEVAVVPPPPRRKIEQPKPLVVEEEHSKAHIVADDPFSSQQVGNIESNKKKNNLLRNRYVQ